MAPEDKPDEIEELEPTSEELATDTLQQAKPANNETGSDTEKPTNENLATDETTPKHDEEIADEAESSDKEHDLNNEETATPRKITVRGWMVATGLITASVLALVIGSAVYHNNLIGLDNESSTEATEEVAEEQVIEEVQVNYCELVPEMIQYPEMQAGCEVYSLTSILYALGYEVDPHVIANEYLPYDTINDDPATAYSGDPYVDGEGLPPAIVRTGNAYLEDAGSDIRFTDITGQTFEELEAIANEGTPVLVWTTMYLRNPRFSTPLAPYTYYTLEHCLVLLGSDDSTVSVMDPMEGYTTYDRDTFASIYVQCGSMAATLEDRS